MAEVVFVPTFTIHPMVFRGADDGVVPQADESRTTTDAADAPIAAQIRKEMDRRDQAARDFKPDSLDEFRRRIAANPDLLRP